MRRRRVIMSPGARCNGARQNKLAVPSVCFESTGLRWIVVSLSANG